MKINLGHGHVAVWNGSHTVNYYDGEGQNYDCITFGFDKDRPTQLEALSAILRREEQDE